MTCIAVVGLGYVGLPLAVEFGKTMKVIGYDYDHDKVKSCIGLEDPAGELTSDQMAEAIHTTYTTDPSNLRKADVVIIAVPTPVDESHQPDFTALGGASAVVGENLKKGAIVIYESTVYPGATEEVCIPVLENLSMMKWKEDFFVGYSPERINPGDKEHTLTKVVKVVAGDTPETLDKVAALYETIVEPGVHRCSSIKVAEACKVIENTQRDLNIALMNELSLIFHKVGIDTLEVLEAAGTKWNFLPFRPGLVGGHCIGVDPYYLTHKAERLGYHPEVILAGRRINDGMAKYIAEQTIKNMINARIPIRGACVNVLGITFKENCADIRNSKVVDMIKELESYGVNVLIHDPLANADEVRHEYGITLTDWSDMPRADATIFAVPHEWYKKLAPIEVAYKSKNVIIDIKALLDDDMQDELCGRYGLNIWRV